DEYGQPGGELVANPDRGLQWNGSRCHVNQQLRVDLRQRIPQIPQLRNPGAMNRMARATQGAVDRLDGITRGAQNDERDRILLGQRAASPVATKWPHYSAHTRLA